MLEQPVFREQEGGQGVLLDRMFWSLSSGQEDSPFSPGHCPPPLAYIRCLALNANITAIYGLAQGLANLFCEGPVSNILGSVDIKVSVTTV